MEPGVMNAVNRTTYFRGGVHPRDRKAASRGKSIVQFPAPGKVFLHLQQSLGAPAEPVVKPGEEVKKGQVVAKARGFVSVPVHTPVSGKVEAIEIHPHPAGPELPAIIVESDQKETWMEGLPHDETDPKVCSEEEIRERIRNAGIVGLGGATFPTHVKLSPPKDKPIDTLILNGCECEPYLTADERLMIEEPEAVLRGARIMARAVGAKRVVVAIEANKPEAVRVMRDTANQLGLEFPVVPLRVRYPQGAEKQLIKTLLNREVPSGGLPMDVAALVQNVGTAAAVDQALRAGVPLMERVVTLTGPGVPAPRNLRTVIGTPIRLLLEVAGVEPEAGAKIVIGGPMMGISQWSLDVPVTKSCSGVLYFRARDLALPEPGPCLRCGTCQRVCPMGLAPNRLNELAELDRFPELEQEGVMDCIECGSCAYACPARIRLVQALKYAKAEIAKARRREQSG